MTLEEIIEGCRRGNAEARRELYVRYGSPMYGVIRRYVSDASTAEDLLHDGFVTLYTRIGDYVSSYSTPEQPVYDIRVLVFNDIHAVPIVRKSFLLEDDPHRSDSIGHDLIRVVTAAFSGNYINIGFEYFRYENGQPHMINLVWDDTRPATDSVYLELRHNAMGEVEGNGRYVVSDTGLASFRIADLVPEGEESIDIKLKSNMDRKDGVGEYIETEKYHTGTYTTGSTAKTYIVGGELYPPENHTAFVRN